MSDTLHFDDPAPIEIGPFAIGERKYVLREASEEAHRQFQAAGMRNMKMVEGKDGRTISAADGAADTDSVLLSHCLFEADEKGGRKAVPLGVIRSWSRHRIVLPLLKKVREISGMNEEADIEAIKRRIEEDQRLLAEIEAVKATEGK